jgi:hypothetical protein
MADDKSKPVAIGLTHSMDTIRLLEEILHDPKFNFGAEGTMVGGYEFWVSLPFVGEAVAAIRMYPKIHIEGHQVDFYNPARALEDGTKYNRLLDHLLGEDPNRPPTNEIRFKC